MALAALLGLGVLLVVIRAVPQHPTAVAVAPALLLVAPAVGYLAWRVEPAWLLTGAIVLNPLAGNWPEVGVPGPLALDRLLLIAGIGSVLVRAPRIRDRPPLRIAPVHWLMGAAVAYVAVSAWVSGTLTETTWFAKLFDAFGVTPFLLFLVVPVAFRERRHRDLLLGALVIFGGYLSLTTLFEKQGVDALVFPSYILDPKVGIHVGQGRGPFVEAVNNGFALYMCAVASAIAFKQWAGQTRSLLAGLVALLCVAGIVISLERSVWLAATVATIVALLTLRSGRRAALGAVAAVVVAVGLSLLAIPGLSDEVSDRFNNQRTIHDRQNLSRAAINMVEARPLVGFGWGQLIPNQIDYFEQASNYPLANIAGTEIHNTALVYAVELGLLGALLWLIVILMGVAGGLSRRGPPDLDDWRVGLVAIAVAYLVVTNFVPPSVFPNLALWLWAGIGWIGFQGAPD